MRALASRELNALHSRPVKSRSRSRLALIGLAAALLLGACATTQAPVGPITIPRPDPAPQQPPVQPPVLTPDPTPDPAVEPKLTPPHLRGEGEGVLVRAALLLPFSSSSAAVRAEAQSMFEAAQFALFLPGADHVVLMPQDTAGDPATAARAARTALRDGADVIIGPLFGTSVDAVSDEARWQAKPVLAFTNDRSRAGNGTYVLGLAPEDEVARMMTFASQELVSNDFNAEPVRFGVLASTSEFGNRVEAAARRYALIAGGQVVDGARYMAGGATDEINGPIAAFAQRARIRSTTLNQPANPVDEGTREVPVMAGYQVDAILIGETGRRLLSVAPLLPFNDIDPRSVKFLAIGAPDADDLLREPALNGAWFTGPDPVLSERFTNQYREIFSDEPSDLAPIAFDAVRMVAELTSLRGAIGLSPGLIERQEGFQGAEGVYRLNPGGVSERALAILELRNGRVRVIDEPTTEFQLSAF
jgi:outer membrane PBP1 activator LpoA protein